MYFPFRFGPKARIISAAKPREVPVINLKIMFPFVNQSPGIFREVFFQIIHDWILSRCGAGDSFCRDSQDTSLSDYGSRKSPGNLCVSITAPDNWNCWRHAFYAECESHPADASSLTYLRGGPMEAQCEDDTF